VINDEELKKTGLFDADAKIYDVDEDLLYFRGNDKPKAPKMNHFEHEKWHEEEFIAAPGGIGSNCWTVSGKLTKSGKPMMACDPHLNKQLQSRWYLLALQWKDHESTEPGEDPTRFMMGGSVVGVPMFTYGRS
jgi:penicillin amidase